METQNWTDSTKSKINNIIEALTEKGINDEKLDESMLQLLGDSFQLYEECKEDLRVNGLTAQGRQQEVKLNPAANILLREQSVIFNILKEFGLSAKSRKALKAEKDLDEDSPLMQFINDNK